MRKLLVFMSLGILIPLHAMEELKEEQPSSYTRETLLDFLPRELRLELGHYLDQPLEEILNPSSVESVAWNPTDDNQIAVGLEQNCLIWDRTTKKELHKLGGISWVRIVAWSPDGTMLATGSNDNYIRLWDPKEGNFLAKLIGHTTPPVTIRWTRNSAKIISASQDGSIRVWDADQEKPLHTTNRPFSKLEAWHSVDKNLTAFAGKNGVVKIKNLETKQILHTLKEHTGPVKAIAWSPHGTFIATGGSDQKICIWDTSTGHLIWTFHLASQITSLDWNYKSTMLASGSKDKYLRIWDMRRLEEFSRLLRIKQNR